MLSDCCWMNKLSPVLLCVVVQLLSRIQLFATLWTAALQASLSFIVSQGLLKFMSVKFVLLSNHLILCRLLLLPSVFLSIRSFPMSWFFASRGQSIEASASVLPMNIQSWFPLGLTDLISLLSVLQHHNSKASILRCSAFFMVQLSH